MPLSYLADNVAAPLDRVPESAQERIDDGSPVLAGRRWIDRVRRDEGDEFATAAIFATHSRTSSGDPAAANIEPISTGVAANGPATSPRAVASTIATASFSNPWPAKYFLY